jgi:hypothetical protein
MQLITSCYAPLRFEKANPLAPAPGPPDYSQSKYWLALPDKRDSADLVIENSGFEDLQATARADVFYVHPTTYIYGKAWNSNINDPQGAIIESYPVKSQASIFNGSCKVYAPRYRQAEFLTYVAFYKRQHQVFSIAYNDVKNAFLYYLNHYNNGRPFVIAAHSQGSDHAIRLCKELIEKDSSLRKRFIVAYLVGSVISESDFENLVPCDSAGQTDCYVTWNTTRWGEVTFFGKPVINAVCVNPLSWKRSTETIASEKNSGSVSTRFDKVDKGLTDAKISPNGLLWVHKPKRTRKEYPRINKRNYHSLDYNWFYVNVRENVQQRVDSYFLQRDTVDRSITKRKTEFDPAK